MTIETRLIALAQAIGADVKALKASDGDLTSLTTTAKGNLVAAINEIKALVGSAGAQINDSAGDGDSTVTWSADKIFDSIELAKTAIKNDLVNGAGSAFDTLSELAAMLNNDPSFAATIATELGNRVRFDGAQVLSAAQKLQACENIGIGNPERDFVADYNTAKA